MRNGVFPFSVHSAAETEAYQCHPTLVGFQYGRKDSKGLCMYVGVRVLTVAEN